MEEKTPQGVFLSSVDDDMSITRHVFAALWFAVAGKQAAGNVRAREKEHVYNGLKIYIIL